MNIENLQKMADHLRTIPEAVFNMKHYRQLVKNRDPQAYYTHTKEDFVKMLESHECNSVGCAIGHCVQLDDWKNVPMEKNGEGIDFDLWAHNFTGLTNDAEILWCFASYWVKTDNTPIGAALRIEWLINHGLPENWDEQIEGINPLCYLEIKS